MLYLTHIADALLLIVMIFLFAVPQLALGELANPPDSALISSPRGSPVVFAGDTLFLIYGRLGRFGPAERAAAISQRLIKLSHDPLYANDTVTFVHNDSFSDLLVGDIQLATVMDSDTLGSTW